MKASALLPDNINNVTINGQSLRKGSVAAFLANVNIIENSSDTTGQAYTDALKDMLELVPVLELLGVFKHLALRSEHIKTIILQAWPDMAGKL